MAVKTAAPREAEAWDLVIKPTNSIFDLNLKEIWRYRDLLALFVKRDFVAQYKQTILGPLWNVIQPIFTTIMFLLIFGKIANIPTDGIKGPLFYMSGITIWNYFATCLTSTSNTFVANAAIFGKVYFPRMVLPLSIVASNVIRFVIQFALLLLMMIYFKVFKQVPLYFGMSWLLLPLLILMMAGLGLGLGIIISSLTTKYRDFSILISFGVQLAMYATPVAYPLSFLLGKSYKWIVLINPLTPIIEAFRYALFHSPEQHFLFSSLLYSLVFMLIALGLGLILFNSVERSFMDTV
jgi:lipopolysaccharide transport system permease protein